MAKIGISFVTIDSYTWSGTGPLHTPSIGLIDEKMMSCALAQKRILGATIPPEIHAAAIQAGFCPCWPRAAVCR